MTLSYSWCENHFAVVIFFLIGHCEARCWRAFAVHIVGRARARRMTSGLRRNPPTGVASPLDWLMRLLLAAGASGDADLETALIGAPSLDIVGHERPDAQAVVLTVADAASAAAAGIPCAVFTSAVAGAAGLSALQAERGSAVSVLAPALHRAPHSLLRDAGHRANRLAALSALDALGAAGPGELAGAD